MQRFNEQPGRTSAGKAGRRSRERRARTQHVTDRLACSPFDVSGPPLRGGVSGPSLVRSAHSLSLGLAARGESRVACETLSHWATETPRHRDLIRILCVSVTPWRISLYLAARADFHHGLLVIGPFLGAPVFWSRLRPSPPCPNFEMDTWRSELDNTLNRAAFRTLRFGFTVGQSRRVRHMSL